MPDFDFRGLTRRQKELLSAGGWRTGMKAAQPDAATVQKLLERGLLIERRSELLSYPSKPFVQYSVPIEVFQAWVDCCALRKQGKVRVGATSI